MTIRHPRRVHPAAPAMFAGATICVAIVVIVLFEHWAVWALATAGCVLLVAYFVFWIFRCLK